MALPTQGYADWFRVEEWAASDYLVRVSGDALPAAGETLGPFFCANFHSLILDFFAGNQDCVVITEWSNDTAFAAPILNDRYNVHASRGLTICPPIRGRYFRVYVAPSPNIATTYNLTLGLTNRQLQFTQTPTETPLIWFEAAAIAAGVTRVDYASYTHPGRAQLMMITTGAMVVTLTQETAGGVGMKQLGGYLFPAGVSYRTDHFYLPNSIVKLNVNNNSGAPQTIWAALTALNE